MTPVELTAGPYRLRPWGPGDLAVRLRAGNDPTISQYVNVAAPYGPAEADADLDRDADGWRDGGRLSWAVCADGVPVAGVHLHPAHPVGVREIGYWCLPEARGRGVVPAAVHAVCRWAFDELGLARLEWATQVGNAASLRVAEKTGFAFEGVIRSSIAPREGRFADGWWAGRLATDGPDGCVPALPDPGVLPVRDALVLRRWRPSDAPALQQALAGADDALPPRPPDVAAADHATWFTTVRAAQDWAAGHRAWLGLFDGEAVVGSLQLVRAGRRDGIAECGVWVAASARRQGVAAAAWESLLAWAVPALGLARLEWHAAPHNAASLALAARLGFVREGVAAGAFPHGPGGGRGDAVILARTVS